MAEKSFVNDDVEIDGVDPELLLLDDDPELDADEVDDDELPQAATPSDAVTATAAIIALLRSKCTFCSPPWVDRLGRRGGARWPRRRAFEL
jgi:hypothetical protein